MWPAERRELHAVDRLGVGRAGLGELAGDPAHLHDRDARAVAEHDRHLEDHLQAIADPVGGEGVEGLGAVTGLQQERPPVGDLREGGGEVAGLAGEHERREAGELLEAGLEGALVGPRRLLRGRVVAPRRGGPGLAHAPKPRPTRRRTSKAVRARKRRSAAPGGRGGRSDRKPGERAVPRLLWRGRWVCPRAESILYRTMPVRYPHLARVFALGRGISQAASLRARASSRTAVTARFTSRRAASAVTPSVSPTSR